MAPVFPPGCNRLRGPMSKVLVLDDNADVAESLGLLLSLHGHEVRAVTTAQAAFGALADFTPDVCLVASACPEWTGIRWRPGCAPRSARGCGCSP